MDNVAASYESRAVPFPHVAIESVSRSFIGFDYSLFIREQTWKEQRGPSHRFQSLENSNVPEFLSAQGIQTFEAHRIKVQEHLHIVLLPRPSIDVFMLDDGDGIGMHDDADANCARIVTKIHHEPVKSAGGALILFGRDLEDTLIYDLEKNCGVAFSSAPGHAHAISTTRGAPILFLVAQFRLAEPL